MPELEQQIKLAQEYGFDYVYIKLPIDLAKRTSELLCGSGGHSNARGQVQINPQQSQKTAG